ncbi:MAG: glycyl-radical enzyme activating protein [Verrucomicrobia bacterium]|nr:glycyl-radical enzyme activating protein [Verrucomicrobiota bacterium]
MVIPVSCTAADRPGTVTEPSVKTVPTGRIFDVKRFSAHDGPGIRSTVFLTGCPLRCAWCHNPESFANGAETGAHFRVRDVTVPGLVRELERDVPYYDTSGGGVTLSGGEPLLQSAFVLELLRACRKRELHTALDTCGHVEPAVLSEAAALSDLILYDLKAMDTNVHREWTGAGNSRILDNLQLLSCLPVEVWIRLPLIPGVNDDARNLEAMIALLSNTRFRRVSILPYHRIAAAKYQRLGLPNRMADVNPPSPDRIEEIRARFTAAGFNPQVGS